MRKFIFDDMGTGKTKRSIDIMLKQQCNSVLVVCPAAVIDTWLSQIAKWAGSSIAISVSANSKKQDREKAESLFQTITPAPFFAIVSYDSLQKAFPLFSKKLDFIRYGAIFDESHYMKEQRSKRSQKARFISAKVDDVLALTATPTPKDAEDIFGQCRVLYPETLERCNILGDQFKTLSAFRNEYGSAFTLWINGRAIVKYSYSARNLARIKTVVQNSRLPIVTAKKNSFAILRCECQEKSVEEQETYDTWVKDWSFSKDVEIDAKTASDVALKRAQLDDGFIYDENGSPHWFGISKIDSVANKACSLSVEFKKPVVIWTRFRASFDFLANQDQSIPITDFLKQYGKKPSLDVLKEYKTLIASPQATGTGVDGLQNLTFLQIWLDLPFTYAAFSQANARLDRRGQKNKVRTYVADTSFNRSVYEVILNRKKLDEIIRDKEG